MIMLHDANAKAIQALQNSPQYTIIVSPYLTDTVATEVISYAEKKTSIVLTTFKVSTFAQGGSSLDVVEKLVKNGFKIKYLDRVHAKIVWTRNVVQIGSQNLTKAGVSNLEATVSIKDPEQIARVERTLRKWCKKANPVTPKKIHAMQAEVLRINADVDAFRAACEKADQNFSSEHNQQDVEQRKIVNAKRRERLGEQRLKNTERENIGELQQITDQLPAAQARVLTLRYVPNGRAGLVAKPRHDMTAWTLNDDRNWIGNKTFRYLLINPLTGRLAWMALFKRYLTNLRTVASDELRIFGEVVKTSISLNDDVALTRLWNVAFTLRQSNEGNIVVRGFYFCRGFRVFSVDVDGKRDAKCKKIKSLLVSPKGDLALKLCELASRAFKYKRNRKLDVSMKDFCPPFSEEVLINFHADEELELFSLKVAKEGAGLDRADEQHNREMQKRLLEIVEQENEEDL